MRLVGTRRVSIQFDRPPIVRLGSSKMPEKLTELKGLFLAADDLPPITLDDGTN